MSELAARPTRRELLGWGAAAFLAGHGCCSREGGPAPRLSERRAMGDARIRGLELLCGAPLDSMRAFYHGKLGLPVADEQPGRLTVAAGATPVTFVSAAEGRPFYHFAFNIPENKVRAARDWQKERSPLLPIPEHLRDPAYPDDVVNYSHWNAHSVFFLDPAGNVVEYIGRHDLKNAAPGGFGSGDILCASEIAFVVDDVGATAEELKRAVGVSQYRGASDEFAALGDEKGLLLVMKRGRILNFDPSTDEKAARVYRTRARVRGAKAATHAFGAYPYEVAVEGPA